MKPIQFFSPALLSSALILLVVFCSCSSSQKITVQGLKHAKIGDTMPSLEKNRFKNHSVIDTLFQEDGYQWKVLKLSNSQGNLYLEAGFFEDTTINRIRVETPEFQVKKQIRVGMLAAELKSLSENWYVNYLEVYQKLDVSAAEMPGIHFLFEVTPDFINGKNPEEAITITDLNPEAQIVSIVVM